MGLLKDKKGLSLFNSADFTVTKIEDYMVDISYGQKDWTMVSALREILANMLDTKTEYNYSYNSGIGTIEDKGNGLPRKAFVIGASSKSTDNTSIGQYGEGLKMALVTSLRYGRRVSIRTVGYGVEIDKTYSEEYSTDLMRLLFNSNTQECGTTIKMECSEEEWNDAIDLFLQFKEGYQKIDNNLFLPGGYISILGLKTEEKPNMLFSYDLNDKTITNRDRNTVKSKKLKENMEKILNNIKTQRAVKMYLDGIDAASESEEYKIVLEPKNADVWKSVILKMYGEKVAYSTTLESDIKATANSYKVIRCATKQVQKTLGNIGIVSSKIASKGVKNNVSIVDKDKITYPISKNYVEGWSYVDAGREMLANALDSATDVLKANIYYKDGYCYIEDNGEGIAKKNFVIGNSQKSNSDIGMFGEGLKLASLVMAREDRAMSIETVDYTYYPILEESEDFGTEVFSIKFEKNTKKSGTVIKFKASEEEVGSIKGLFITFKEGVSKLSFDTIEVLLNESNNIYVNGLKSASIDTIFAYNVKDKTLVNTRDRNHINEAKLTDILVYFYNTIDDEVVISKFLTEWQTNKYLYEYKLIVTPRDLNKWQDVAKGLFENYCLVSADMEDNFIAKKAGYRVLSDIPPYVKEILEYCIPRSSEVASEYREKGILFGDKIIYPITDNYISNWSRTDAITELISNAIDTSTDVSLCSEGGTVTIEDKGLGLDKKNLLLGGSGSQNVGKAIGTFGEGLKMSALTLAKLNSKLRIDTVGFSVDVVLEKDKEFDVNVLVFTLTETDREVGTKITFKGSKGDLEDSKGRFLQYSELFKIVADAENIYTPGGFIFVNGVESMKINSKYSYNLEGYSAKKLLNRDRKTLNLESCADMIGNMIGETNSKVLMESMFNLTNTSQYENMLANRTYCIRGQKKRKWRAVMNEVFVNCCLPDGNSEINLVAKDSGFKVLTDLTNLQNALLNYLGMPNSRGVVQLRGDEDVARRVIDPKLLSRKEIVKWDKIKSVVEKEYGSTMVEHLLICEEFVNPDGGETHGLYSSSNGKCYILRKLLSDSYTLSYTLGVMIHEIVHKVTSSYDRTREFENALTNTIGKLLYKLYK